MPKTTRAPLGPTQSKAHRITKPTTRYGTRSSERTQDQPERRKTPPVKSPPSPDSEDIAEFSKRKRREGEENEISDPNDQRKRKRTINTAEAHPDPSDSIGYWVANGCEWSEHLRGSRSVDDRPSGRFQKRPLSRSTSYRQSTLSGDTSKAWGRKHAADMLEAGVFMEQQEGATIAEEDERLCQAILEARYELPKDWCFDVDNFAAMLKQMQYRNEKRVERDLHPIIMPSPELHHLRGIPGLGHINEALDAQWTKCPSLCGPQPKADACHGLSRYLFDKEERAKLTSDNTCASELMLYPFYICEAKSFEGSSETAELQALHSASTASKAIIELFEKIGAADELNQRVLAMSVAHNARVVKISGHFPVIHESKVTYHCHRLFQVDLMNEPANRFRPYHIARGIWEHFQPLHLSRIRDALARQQVPTMESFHLDFEGAASQSSTPPSSQEGSAPKRQSVSSKHDLQLASLLEELREQRETMTKEREAMAKQTERHDKQMERQSEQHKEQMEQHKEQMEQLKEQVEQQKEIIALLKQAKP